MSMYTDRKVYHRLAEKLGNGTPVSGHAARFSSIGDIGGIAAQRAAHFSIYSANPDIAKMSTFPDAAWDPSTPEIGARYGVRWITLSDLHHTARGDQPIAAVVSVGDAVLLHITLSATTKQIPREDGEDLNGVTVLIMALLNHFPSLREMCWADDVSRAGRDRADWTLITTKCKHRDITMVFGGQRYDQRNLGDELSLGTLGLVGGNDDPMRRRKLTGKRLLKYKKGGVALAEMQMPHGWGQKCDKHGRPVREGDKGLVPEADPSMVPVIKALYAAHASGEDYQKLAYRMVAFEKDGVLQRRDHTNLDNTYRLTAGDPLARYGAAKSFFVRSNFRPPCAPSEQDIARYVAGEDPAEVFGPDTRLFIAKVELVRTGRYFRRLKNDIRGRNIVLDGIPANYRNDRDEHGWYDVLSEPWAWPLDEAGREVPRFGVPDEICRKVAARLLRELRAPRARTGGQAHRTASRRVFQGFENWAVLAGEPGSRYADEPTQWGVEARQNNSGKANFILLFRRESDSRRDGVRRSWSYFGAGESRPDHIAATGSLAELAASVANHLDTAVRGLADPASISTVKQLPAPELAPDECAVWQHRVDLRRGEIKELLGEANGHRKLAAFAANAGDDEEAQAYFLQASEVAARVRTLESEVERMVAKIDRRRRGRQDVTAREEEADISVAAHLVAGLEAASRRNGEAPSLLGRLCDDTFTGWRFQPESEDLLWTCDALLPLRSGDHARLPLAGTIRNVRTRRGKSLATTETVIRYLFEEGRDASDVSALLQCTRKTLIVNRVMPWLVAHGVTSRGAKCALVDHPVPSVRQELHGWLTRTPEDAVIPFTSAFVDLLQRTYRDPDLAWGDAAVPDDTTWIAHVLGLVTVDTQTRKHGLPVLDVALAVGRSEREVRGLVTPARRSAGFTRPRFLAWANKAKTHVKAIGCPHDRCKGRRFADRVALFPEVAASGYGVICARCRRAPTLAGDWQRIQFPGAYATTLWTSRGLGGSLRTEAQTVSASPGPALGQR